MQRRNALSVDGWRKVIEINLVGSFLVSVQAAVLMQRNEPNAAGERGVIVMTASAGSAPAGTIRVVPSRLTMPPVAAVISMLADIPVPLGPPVLSAPQPSAARLDNPTPTTCTCIERPRAGDIVRR